MSHKRKKNSNALRLTVIAVFAVILLSFLIAVFNTSNFDTRSKAQGPYASCNDNYCSNVKNGSNWQITNCDVADPNGDQQLCDTAGRIGSCRATSYCCPAPGSLWVTDMTSCTGPTPTPFFTNEQCFNVSQTRSCIPNPLPSPGYACTQTCTSKSGAPGDPVYYWSACGACVRTTTTIPPISSPTPTPGTFVSYSCDSVCAGQGKVCATIGTDVAGTNSQYMVNTGGGCYPLGGGCSTVMTDLGYSCVDGNTGNLRKTMYTNCTCQPKPTLIPTYTLAPTRTPTKSPTPSRTPTPSRIPTSTPSRQQTVLNDGKGVNCNQLCSSTYGLSCKGIYTFRNGAKLDKFYTARYIDQYTCSADPGGCSTKMNSKGVTCDNQPVQSATCVCGPLR